MTQEQINEILDNAYIPEEWRKDCFITEDGMIFTPCFDDAGSLIKTGEQVHAEWLAQKDAPTEPVITPEMQIQALEEQVAVLNEELTMTNVYMTDLELELFELKTMITPQ